MRDDDPFRRHLDDYAAVGRESAVPPMVHEIYRRGRRHQRLQTVTWGVVGALTLIATFLAGMVVRDQTDPTVAGAALPTTSAPPTSVFGLFPSPSPQPTATTLFPPTTSDPFTTGTLYTTTSYPYTTSSYPYTTTTSGSSTGVAVPLTSGKHSVILKSITDSRVQFDKVEFFRGDDAVREAAEDGRTPTSGYYIRNMNPALRTHTATSTVKVQVTNRTMGRSGTPGQLTTVTLAQLAAKIPAANTLFRITLVDAKITAITEYNLG